ncbi:MAG: hypothetical protein CV089_12660 [Nitrospira sp. WS110]|nr:hypothetical protein [Nitrospira sp. WS110]
MAKAKPRKKNQQSQLSSEAILARARALRQTPQGIQLTDRLLRSLKREWEGMTTGDLPENR